MFCNPISVLRGRERERDRERDRERLGKEGWRMGERASEKDFTLPTCSKVLTWKALFTSPSGRPVIPLTHYTSFSCYRLQSVPAPNHLLLEAFSRAAINPIRQPSWRQSSSALSSPTRQHKFTHIAPVVQPIWPICICVDRWLTNKAS